MHTKEISLLICQRLREVQHRTAKKDWSSFEKEQDAYPRWMLLVGFIFIVSLNGLRLHIFNWPCWIIKILATRAKFLEPSGYNFLKNYAFTLCTTNVFSWLHNFMAQFELTKHKFPIYITFNLHFSKYCKTFSLSNLLHSNKRNLKCVFCVDVYIYIYRERERKTDRQTVYRKSQFACTNDFIFFHFLKLNNG